jgi:hypothetical protein
VSCARGCCTAAGTAAGDAIEAAFEVKNLILKGSSAGLPVAHN